MNRRRLDKFDAPRSVRSYPWDVTVENEPYVAGTLEGDEPGSDLLWCWPRGEMPTRENLLEYELDEPVSWGLSYDEKHVRIKRKGQPVARSIRRTVITRNGKLFYTVMGKASCSIPKALVLLEKIQHHPLGFDEMGFAERMIGRKIWWHSQKAIITRYLPGECSIIAVPDGTSCFSIPREISEDPEMEGVLREIRIDCLEDPGVFWYRSDGGLE